MPQSSNQEFLARRFQTSFECELPPDARQEMFKPKRPVSLEPSRVEHRVDRSGWLMWIGGAAMVLTILAVVISQSRKTLATPQSAPTTQSTPMPPKPASQPVATPAPVVQAPPPAVSAPKASLVLYRKWMGSGVWELVDSTGRVLKILVDPAPRAQRVDLPPSPLRLVELTAQHINETHVITMPYGTEVSATLRGFLGSDTQLPRAGHIGDMYVAGNVPWIWIFAPGASHADWIDP